LNFSRHPQDIDLHEHAGGTLHSSAHDEVMEPSHRHVLEPWEALIVLEESQA
jgi:hypothetical protein